MELAKHCFDVGLATNNRDAMLEFWQHEIGLPLLQTVPIRSGFDVHCLDAMGSVVKINHFQAPLPDTPPSGYRELILARPGIPHPQHLTDPDGNRICLVPPGTDGVDQIGMRMAIRNLEPHRGFYRTALGLSEETYIHGAAFRAGRSLILTEEKPDAPDDATFEGRGWRYITFAPVNVDAAHAYAVAHGAREGAPPRTMGTLAHFSLLRDPDGNWIEFAEQSILSGP